VVRALLEHGAGLVRINCAHDDAETWARMIRNVRDASAELGKPCVVTMDLAGPKLRTVGLGEPLVLREGDRVLLTDGQAERGGAIPSVRLSIGRVLGFVRAGESVFFDDGKVGGVIEHVDAGGAIVRVRSARGGKVELANDKGVNFPDTALGIPGVTEKDREDLAFVGANADVASLSFVQHRADVRAAAEALDNARAGRVGMVLKIETRFGFEALPRLLLDALGTRPLGVMIARGDLALEIGYERLAEVQEEILWICEAAHVPVIWATQVLERMAKDGIPTRAEVTDAAMAARAECVMLNKGKHIDLAVSALGDILRRMQAHQHKKIATLRPLHISLATPDA
jgi:pyruvate kinase